LKTAATTDKNYKKATIIILPQERSFSFYSSLSNIFFNKKKFKKKQAEILIISPSQHKRTNLGDLCF